MLLTLDSALGNGSAAVFNGAECVAYADIFEKGAQAQYLISIVEQVLKRANIDYSDLDMLACTVGPGGFTGIRIALAAARAIATTAKKPIIGLSTLACLAFGYAQHAGASASPLVLAALPAGKGSIYAQEFNITQCLPMTEAKLMSTHEAKELTYPIITADVSEIFGLEECIHQKFSVNAKTLGNLCADSRLAHLHLAAEPLYIRPPDISQPKVNKLQN